MLSVNQSAFLAIPNPQNKRILHEARVVEMDGQRVVLEFDQAFTAARVEAPAGEVTLYAQVRGKFFQQAAGVTGVQQTPPTLRVQLQTMGEAISAEKRGSYRTGVAAWNAQVRINNITHCRLADVSAEGIGVICPKPLTVGTMVDVALDLEGVQIAGQLRVQTAKILPSGKLRFGLFVPDRRSETRAQLQRLASHMQRAQLKRLSGAA